MNVVAGHQFVGHRVTDREKQDAQKNNRLRKEEGNNKHPEDVIAIGGDVFELFTAHQVAKDPQRHRIQARETKPQQVCGNHLGGLGMGVIPLGLEQAVPFRPVQPDRDCRVPESSASNHQECGDPESVAAHALARPWLDVCDPYRRNARETIRAGQSVATGPALDLWQAQFEHMCRLLQRARSVRSPATAKV